MPIPCGETLPLTLRTIKGFTNGPSAIGSAKGGLPGGPPRGGGRSLGPPPGGGGLAPPPGGGSGGQPIVLPCQSDRYSRIGCFCSGSGTGAGFGRSLGVSTTCLFRCLTCQSGSASCRGSCGASAVGLFFSLAGRVGSADVCRP